MERGLGVQSIMMLALVDRFRRCIPIAKRYIRRLPKASMKDFPVFHKTGDFRGFFLFTRMSTNDDKNDGFPLIEPDNYLG